MCNAKYSSLFIPVQLSGLHNGNAESVGFVGMNELNAAACKNSREL